MLGCGVLLFNIRRDGLLGNQGHAQDRSLCPDGVGLPSVATANARAGQVQEARKGVLEMCKLLAWED